MPHRDNFDAARNVRYIEGRFFTNGASAISAATIKGPGALLTVTRTGVGTATVKVLVVCQDLLDVSATLSKNAIAARFLQVLGATQGADGMFTVNLALTDMTGTGAVEFDAANANAWISFRVELQMGLSVA